MSDQWDTRASVLARLCAPLPAAEYQQSLATIAALGLRAVELTPSWLDVSEDESVVAETERELAFRGIEAALVRLPPRQAPPRELDEVVATALALAARLKAPYAVLSSAALDQEGDVAGRLSALAERAEAAGVTLLLENHPRGIATGEALGAMVAAVGRPVLAGAVDPAGFVAMRKHPFLTEFMAGPLKRQVRCLRLRDALFDGTEVPPNQGNAELKELVSALECRGYRGRYVLSPFGPRPYADNLRSAHAAVKAVLEGL